MTIEEIWKLYKETEEAKLKHKLIEHYAKLVKIVAGRMYNYYAGNVEYEDLISFGVFGLIDAIDKFDINRDLKFETYAQIRIRGSIIDNLRKIDWVPRGVRKKVRELEDAISKVENRLGRSATTQEIADELAVDKIEVENTLTEIAGINILSLENTLATKGDITFSIDNIENPEKIFENKEIKEILRDSISRLSEKEKIVISLYYFNELTYKEIANILSVSESRISQLHSKAIISLKNILTSKGITQY